MIPRLRVACLLIALLPLVHPVALRAQFDQLSLAERYIYTNAMMGTDFWVVVPPNDDVAQPGRELTLTIDAPLRTTATVQGEEVQVPRVLMSSRGGTSWDWEVRDLETVVQKAIHVTSKEPVSVSLNSNREFSGEAMMILPTSEWDTSYIVTSYYDYGESRPWAGGFCIVAGSDSTVVTIALRGSGAQGGATTGGRLLGDTWQVAMNAGDVYCVQGNGTTRGVFDLTGTSVTSTHPIGVVNYHQRTAIPSLVQSLSGRDNLMEMATPVSKWGQRYATVGHDRSGAGAGTGDVYRVIASQPSTTWTVKHYSLETSEPLAVEGGVITNAGGMAEVSNVDARTDLFSGLTVWEANKPIQVVQFAASASWDEDALLDPMQNNLVPLDRAPMAMPIHHSSDASYTVRRTYVIVQVDPDVVAVGKASGDSSIIHTLQAITVEDPLRLVTEPLWSHPNAKRGNLLDHHIGDGLFWAELEYLFTETAPTIIAGDRRVRIVGYSAGYGLSGTYAVQSGGRHSLAGSASTIDTAAPVVRITGFNGGLLTFTCTENTNSPAAGGLPAQADVGIMRATAMGFPQNMVVQSDSATIIEGGRVRERIIVAQRVDTTKQSFMRLAAADRLGNVRYVDYLYTTPKNPRYTVGSVRAIGSAPVGTTICVTQHPFIRIQGDTAVTVTDIRVDSNAAVFSIDTTSPRKWSFPVELAPAQSYPLTCLCATPTKVGVDTGVVTIVSNAFDAPEQELTVTVIGTEPTSVSGDDELFTTTATARYDGSSILVRWPEHATVSSWVLYDLHGAALLRGGIPADSTPSLMLQTPALARGTYFVGLSGPDTQYTVAVVVH